MRDKIEEILKESVADNPDVLEWQREKLLDLFNQELEKREKDVWAGLIRWANKVDDNDEIGKAIGKPIIDPQMYAMIITLKEKLLTKKG